MKSIPVLISGARYRITAAVDRLSDEIERIRRWPSRLYWAWRTGSDYPVYSPVSPALGAEGVMSSDQFTAWCSAVRESIGAAGWLNSMSLYERFVDGLIACKTADVVPLGSIGDASPGSRTRVALRHDVDAGIRVAPDMAEILEARGVAGTFYLLHTAAYYGVFVQNEPGLFLRQPAAMPFIERMIRSGCEIGLHNDALSVFFEHNTNGYAAVATEIAWLRSLGAEVKSTTAHNSAPLFGAENFEVFSEHTKRRERLAFKDRSFLMGRISARSLGLEFEGNHPILCDPGQELDSYLHFTPHSLRDTKWLERHFLENPLYRSAYSTDIWLIGEDAWFIASRWPEPEVRNPVTTEEVLAFIAADRNGRSIVANIHPDYFV